MKHEGTWGKAGSLPLAQSLLQVCHPCPHSCLFCGPQVKPIRFPCRLCFFPAVCEEIGYSYAEYWSILVGPQSSLETQMARRGGRCWRRRHCCLSASSQRTCDLRIGRRLRRQTPPAPVCCTAQGGGQARILVSAWETRISKQPGRVTKPPRELQTQQGDLWPLSWAHPHECSRRELPMASVSSHRSEQALLAEAGRGTPVRAAA